MGNNPTLARVRTLVRATSHSRFRRSTDSHPAKPRAMPENGLRLSVHASVRARQQALDSLFTSSWVLAHKRAHSFGGTGVEPSPRSRRAQADPTLGKGGRRSLTAQPPEPIAASPTVRPGGVDSTPSDCRADRSNGLRYLRDLWSQVLTCECDIRADVLGA